MRSFTLVATAVVALAATSSFASNNVTATGSAGFQTAQLTNSEGFAGACTYPAPTYQPVCTASPQQSAIAESDFNFRGQTAKASAEVAGPGLLRASASVSSASPPLDTLSASSRASFNDELTFNAAGLTGQSVLVFLNYSISGTGSFTQDAYQSGSYGNAYLSLSLAGNQSVTNAYAGSGYTSGFFNPDFQYSGYRVFSAVLGTAQNLGISVNASCVGGASVGGFGCATDASFSFLGVSGLALPDGTEITNFAVNSSSGFDYANALAPVPEPATYLMLLFGLSALGAIRVVRQSK
jgi:hypothetical protein